jgi:SAM-dependent methyltransferase
MPGYVEKLTPFDVSGWAVQADGKSRERVAIFVDGRKVAEIPCEFPRPDCQQAGFGDGFCGFRFFFPEAIGAGRPAEVAIRTVSAAEPLKLVSSIPSWSVENSITHFVSAFAADPYSLTFVEDGGNSNPRSGDGATELNVTARVIAPRQALIGVIPLEDDSEIVVKQIECNDEPVYPSHAPSDYRQLRFSFTSPKVAARKYAAFGLVDLSVPEPTNQCKLVNPAATMCLPLDLDWLPTPDDANVTRICAGPVPAPLVKISGVNIAYQMLHLAAHFLGKRPSRILDWGIGCGRVAAPMSLIAPESSIIGVDVDRVNIEWCKQNLPRIDTMLSDFFPPLDLLSESIDMAYGISVMTHLTQGAQMAWIKELRRILTPGGICILTIHGPYACHLHGGDRSPDVVKQWLTVGISDWTLDTISLGSLLDIKTYYRGTYQAFEHIQSEWSRYLSVIGYFPAGVQSIQDIVVLRKESR